VAEHLMELLLLADACRRAGAARITAILPYFGYARQDRRAGGLEPVSARVVADLVSIAADRIVAVDLHSPALEGFFSVPLEHLSAVPLLAEAFRPARTSDQVLVAPDHGAVKLVHRYAQLLDLPTATVHKVRHSGREVSACGVTGSVKDKTPVIIDDMIATGGTLVAAVEAVLEAGGRSDVTLIASHALLVGNAVDRLRRLPLRTIIASDSVAWQSDPDLPLRKVSLAGMLAEAVARLAGEA
jgi:ribose-phosphate pyrophosphokinase